MRLILLSLLLCLQIQTALAETVVRVGGYLFPPFVDTSSSPPEGLTIELIELLNQQQTEFQFSFVLTSPKRRFIDFKRDKFDALFFEDKLWGWKDLPVTSSQVFLEGGEVYITAKQDEKDQSYFNRISTRSLVGILGYHYQFSNFISDEKTLKKQFNIQLVTSPSTIINQVLSNKADIGIITRSYLYAYLAQHPTVKPLLLVSDKLDQKYEHTLLIKDKRPFTTAHANALLDQVKKSGQLQKLLSKHGLTLPE